MALWYAWCRATMAVPLHLDRLIVAYKDNHSPEMTRSPFPDQTQAKRITSSLILGNRKARLGIK